MKIICLVFLVFIFAIGSEAWGVRTPRVSTPRIRTPRVRWPRVRVRLPNVLKRCGNQKKTDCGSNLVRRVVSVCNRPLCRKIGKRSIDSQDFPDRKYFIRIHLHDSQRIRNLEILNVLYKPVRFFGLIAYILPCRFVT